QCRNVLITALALAVITVEPASGLDRPPGREAIPPENRTAASADLAPQAPQATTTVQATEAASGRPPPAVQIRVGGPTKGGHTNASGQYDLWGVPAGGITVVARSIGSGQVSQVVTVASGQEGTLDFQLGSEALGLDEIVVNGTAGGTQRRAVGNVVERIDA